VSGDPELVHLRLRNTNSIIATPRAESADCAIVLL
jgi:hypothetical protein